MNCPGCQSPAVEKRFEGITGTPIPLDVCHGCHGLWFDKSESMRLSPAGVLRLFRELHTPEPHERHPPAESMKCPRCHAALGRTYDMARNNRFHYYRCPQGHGHFIPFFQFLREKGIVRTLTLRERNELQQRMPTVRCSHCAAPVDVGTQAECPHCQTPVSVLDASGVEALLQKQPGQKQPDARRVRAATSLPLPLAPSRRSTADDSGSVGVDLGVDLVGVGLEVLLGSLLEL